MYIGSAIELSITLDDIADSVTAKIYSPNGEVVKTAALTHSGGNTWIYNWQTLPTDPVGEYKIEYSIEANGYTVLAIRRYTFFPIT